MQILPAKNLFQTKQQAKNTDKKILLLLHLQDCPWCHFVIKEVIEPMIELDEYSDKLIIRQIETSENLDMYGFDGAQISNDYFALKHKVDFYPTLLLFDADGRLLDKVIGVASKEFYWTELDKILNKQGVL
ncbi:MAG: hypothetical protein FXV79_01150 [Candidatus Thioglobus sp.]|nr:MAG: hypothetical protein FXV80_01290 [Candidatus Thioglobus sp.]KAA0454980.1 MAG: hypothetical protein FXV79_01150 [Candidatus Thioglobus sp.]